MKCRINSALFVAARILIKNAGDGFKLENTLGGAKKLKKQKT
jgi:hypothetical protein